MSGLLTSYFGIVIFLASTGCGLPLPEEVGIIAAGGFASQHVLNPWLALAACIVGCLLGDSIMYVIGRHFGRRVLQAGSFWSKLITPERERQIEEKIKQHGLKAFFLARFLVGVRGPMYLTLGILEVPFLWFLAIDALSATVVIAMFFSLSYFCGTWIGGWIHNGELVLTIVFVVGVLAVIGFFIWHHRRSVRRKAAEAEAGKGRATAGSSTDQSLVLTDKPPLPAAANAAAISAGPGTVPSTTESTPATSNRNGDAASTHSPQHPDSAEPRK